MSGLDKLLPESDLLNIFKKAFVCVFDSIVLNWKFLKYGYLKHMRINERIDNVP